VLLRKSLLSLYFSLPSLSGALAPTKFSHERDRERERRETERRDRKERDREERDRGERQREGNVV